MRARQIKIRGNIVRCCSYSLSERNIIVVAFASGVVYAMLQSNITISWTGPLPQGIPDFTPPNLTLTLPNGTNYTVILANGTSIIHTLPNTTQTIPFWKIASVNSKFYLFFS